MKLLIGNHAALSHDLEVMSLGARHIAQQCDALSDRIREFTDRHESLTAYLSFLATMRKLAADTEEKLAFCARVEMAVGKREVVNAVDVAHPGLTEWLAGGERGISSNTIVQHLTGLPAGGEWAPSPPWDEDDLRRCRLLLKAVPSLVPLLPRMRELEGWSPWVDQLESSLNAAVAALERR